MAETHDRLRCPICQSVMQTGFLPTSTGMHFIRGDGKAASQFAEDLPGTHAIMRSNRLLAWRCKSCEVVIFKYGRNNAKKVERLLEEDTLVEQQSAEMLEAMDDENKSTRRSG
ncbi:MAG: PF20097 family protein [Planctomycetota bacterium]